MSEMKPCPFCGCDDVFVTNMRSVRPLDRLANCEMSVVCLGCEVGVSFGYVAETRETITEGQIEAYEAETIEAWNKRAV